MILLDAYALIAAATAEPAADEVAGLLRGEETCAIATVNLAELWDQLVRRVGLDPAEVDERVRPLVEETLTRIDLTEQRAIDAGLLRARLSRKGVADLSLADCVLLATLVSLGEGHRLATADPPLANAARELGHEVVALPDSRGRRP